MINLPSQAARQRERILFEREINNIARGARKQLRIEINRFTRELGNRYKDGVRTALVADSLPEHRNQISKILRGLYTRSMEAGGRRLINAAKTWRPMFETKTEETAIRLTLDLWIAEILPLRVKQISATSRQNALRAIAQGIASEETVAQISRRLVGAGFSRVRSDRIARTESLASASSSQHKVAQKINPEFKKRWVATLDSRTRDTHSEADGQMRGMKLPFDINGSEMQYPRDIGAPAAEVVNCRCVVIYEE